MGRYFITGIGTGVGKTLVSAVVVEALRADYWKPIQAGDLEDSDTDTVRDLISNPRSFFHPNSYALKTPMSPHAAAAIDGVTISSEAVRAPETSNKLVIEGAGGVLVPINDKETIIDLIQPDDRIILVSQHYLGSINHTLLTVETLRSRNLNCIGLVFNGDPNPSSEDVIQKMTRLPVLLRMKKELSFGKAEVQKYAALLEKTLEK